MKKIAKRTKSILIILALALVAIVGATIAYYTSKNDFKNEFHVSEPGVAVVEKFNPSDQWVPGEEKTKEVWFTNSGEVDMLLRFHVEVDWEEDSKPASASEASQIVTLNRNTAFEKNFCSFKENDKDYYYYKKVLKPGEVTSNVLDSVTFSSALSNDGHGVNYANSQVNITIIGETVIAEANESGYVEAAEEWNKTAQITDDVSGKKTVTWENKQ